MFVPRVLLLIHTLRQLTSIHGSGGYALLRLQRQIASTPEHVYVYRSSY